MRESKNTFDVIPWLDDGIQKNNFQIIKTFPQEVWSLEQVKNYMRVEASYDDDLIIGLIDAAITAAENFTKLNFILKQIKFICNISGKKEFLFKYNPLIKITKIKKKFKDQENDLTADDYAIEQNLLTLNKALSNEELTVEYISGYDKKNIPHAIKHGIMLHIAEMYDRQTTNCIGFSKEVKNLYLPYRNIQIWEIWHLLSYRGLSTVSS